MLHTSGDLNTTFHTKYGDWNITCHADIWWSKYISYKCRIKNTKSHTHGDLNTTFHTRGRIPWPWQKPFLHFSVLYNSWLWWWLFPHLQGFGGKVQQFIPCLHYLIFLKWRSACEYRIDFSGQDQSTVAQKAEMTVAECSLMSCMWTHFPDRFPYYAWTA